MSIIRIDPNLIDSQGASDGDVLKYVSANSSVEFGFAGDVSNTWVNANDYSTYTSLTSLIDTVQGNLTSLIGAAPSTLDTLAEISAALENDANLAVTLTNQINTIQDNVNIVSGNADLQANSHSSSFWLTYPNLTELQANYVAGAFSVVDDEDSAYFGYGGSWTRLAESLEVDLIQDNVDSLTSTVDSADANLYNTYNTLTANTYNTYVSLSSLIDTVQDNVGAGGGGGSSTFTDLTDTPSSFSGSGGKLLVVNDAETALEVSDYAFETEIAHDSFTVSTSNTFTLSRSIADANAVVVTLNGVVQNPVTNYTATGTTLTIANTLPLESGLALGVRHIGGSITGHYNTNEVWSVVDSNSTLTANNYYFIDCANSAITVTFPTPPVMGMKIKVIDATGSANTNPITLNSGGYKIMGDAGDMTISTHRAALTLVYFNADHGWVLGEI